MQSISSVHTQVQQSEARVPFRVRAALTNLLKLHFEYVFAIAKGGTTDLAQALHHYNPIAKMDRTWDAGVVVDMPNANLISVGQRRGMNENDTNTHSYPFKQKYQA